MGIIGNIIHAAIKGIGNSSTITINGQTYIDGKRMKNGNNFFTPILPPAMKILK